MYDRPHFNHMNHDRPYIQQSPFNKPVPKTKESFQTPFEYFSKPSQPINWHPGYKHGSHNFNTGIEGNDLFHYFQEKKGEVDLDKMLSTIGQVANTVQQVSPVVKQLGALMKQIK
ncbi:YppG family protein [Virgibacillus siamensis]|uniref:YppG family protein n=1 Tax=Virgibacillus siamensis TaxID=480071 RepID=UPI0009849D7B|nr:YppG family protein [Virgibacillus siamensis]